MTHRFINADPKYVSTGTGIIGLNMFTYCNNNPVNCSDPTGGKTIRELQMDITYGDTTYNIMDITMMQKSGGVGAGVRVSNYSVTNSLDLFFAGVESGVVSEKTIMGNTNKSIVFFFESDEEWWKTHKANFGVGLNFNSGTEIEFAKNVNDISLTITEDGVSHSLSYGTDEISYTVESGIENINGIYSGSYSQFYYRPKTMAIPLVMALIPESSVAVYLAFGCK